ncbi:Aste57867_13581 [Aphanomyces stellatus]|uniref:Aste57867_13581 protein n=1 Tax=Aphanomyces stellatus TaxID=120398 RepID=A0A485KZD1_9STRA|nr:hypothetical protein As57867_013531 [Aphanomyces stellatus]VFT90419.1 Aste57867_13581 [Aphanomyces stellatus]
MIDDEKAALEAELARQLADLSDDDHDHEGDDDDGDDAVFLTDIPKQLDPPRTDDHIVTSYRRLDLDQLLSEIATVDEAPSTNLAAYAAATAACDHELLGAVQAILEDVHTTCVVTAVVTAVITAPPATSLRLGAFSPVNQGNDDDDDVRLADEASTPSYCDAHCQPTCVGPCATHCSPRCVHFLALLAARDTAEAAREAEDVAMLARAHAAVATLTAAARCPPPTAVVTATPGGPIVDGTTLRAATSSHGDPNPTRDEPSVVASLSTTPAASAASSSTAPSFAPSSAITTTFTLPPANTTTPLTASTNPMDEAMLDAAAKARARVVQVEAVERMREAQERAAAAEAMMRAAAQRQREVARRAQWEASDVRRRAEERRRAAAASEKAAEAMARLAMEDHDRASRLSALESMRVERRRQEAAARDAMDVEDCLAAVWRRQEVIARERKRRQREEAKEATARREMDEEERDQRTKERQWREWHIEQAKEAERAHRQLQQQQALAAERDRIEQIKQQKLQAEARKLAEAKAALEEKQRAERAERQRQQQEQAERDRADAARRQQLELEKQQKQQLRAYFDANVRGAVVAAAQRGREQAQAAHEDARSQHVEAAAKKQHEKQQKQHRVQRWQQTKWLRTWRAAATSSRSQRQAKRNKAAGQIQRQWRRCQRNQNQHIVAQTEAAKVVQAWWRRILEMENQERRIRAARHVAFQAMQRAARRVQLAWRRRHQQKQQATHQQQQHRDAAAKSVQSVFRGFHIRKKLASALEQAKFVDGDEFDYNEVDLDDFLGGAPELDEDDEADVSVAATLRWSSSPSHDECGGDGGSAPRHGNQSPRDDDDDARDDEDGVDGVSLSSPPPHHVSSSIAGPSFPSTACSSSEPPSSMSTLYKRMQKAIAHGRKAKHPSKAKPIAKDSTATSVTWSTSGKKAKKVNVPSLVDRLRRTTASNR